MIQSSHGCNWLIGYHSDCTEETQETATIQKLHLQISIVLFLVLFLLRIETNLCFSWWFTLHLAVLYLLWCLSPQRWNFGRAINVFFFFPKKGDGMKGNYTILKIIPDDLSISYLQKLKVISTWFVDLIPISTSIPKHSNSPGQKDIFFSLAACPKSSILLVKVTLKSHISNLLSCHFLSEHLQGSPAKWWQQPRFPLDFPSSQS